jgi:hypothetical protein
VRDEDLSWLLRGVGILAMKRRGFRLYFLGRWEAFS